MGRKPKEIPDTSTYTDLGVFSWKEAEKHERLQISVFRTSPCREMISGEFVKVSYNHKDATRWAIKYDKEYVLEYLFRFVVKPVGLVADGNLSENAWNEFCNDLKSYAQSESQRLLDEQNKVTAKDLAEKYPHMSFEQWLETLSNKGKPPRNDKAK